MPKVAIDCDVRCAICGDRLSADFTEGSRDTDALMDVEPCERCVDAARDKGYEEGRTEAEREA